VKEQTEKIKDQTPEGEDYPNKSTEDPAHFGKISEKGDAASTGELAQAQHKRAE